MALGLFLLDGVTKVCPDKGLPKNSTPKIHLATFGDGYEQRIPDGINSLKETLEVSFNNRPIEEVDRLQALFESLKGVTPINFTIPDSEAIGGERNILVVCTSWSLTYTNTIAYGIRVSMRRVYEP